MEKMFQTTAVSYHQHHNIHRSSTLYFMKDEAEIVFTYINQISMVQNVCNFTVTGHNSACV